MIWQENESGKSFGKRAFMLLFEKIDSIPSESEERNRKFHFDRSSLFAVCLLGRAFVFAKSLNRSRETSVRTAICETISYKLLVLLTILEQLSLHRLRQIWRTMRRCSCCIVPDISHQDNKKFLATRLQSTAHHLSEQLQANHLFLLAERSRLLIWWSHKLQRSITASTSLSDVLSTRISRILSDTEQKWTLSINR